MGNPAVRLWVTKSRPETAGSNRSVRKWCGREKHSDEEEVLGERQRDQLREQRVARELGDVATATFKEEEDVEGNQAQVDLLRPPESTRSLCEDLKTIELERCLSCPETKMAVRFMVIDEAILPIDAGSVSVFSLMSVCLLTLQVPRCRAG